MKCLERDKKTIDKLKKNFRIYKSLNKAIKSVCTWRRYTYLKEKYPEIIAEFDAIQKEILIDIDKKKQATKKKPVKLKKHTMQGDELYNYVYKKVTEEKYSIRELKKQRLISLKSWMDIPEEKREIINKITRKIAMEKKYGDYIPESKPCAVCGKMMHYEDYIKSLAKAQKEGFIKKMACSEECAHELRKRNYRIITTPKYLEFGEPLTFYDYVMGELCHMYSDRNEPQHRYLEILAEEICLPLEQLERIIDGQEQLTVKIAERLRMAGVCFSLDSMFKIAAKAQRR